MLKFYVDLDEDFANRGEINAKMLKDVGTDFVFIGHRKDKKLTTSSFVRIRKKILSAIQNKWKVANGDPIFLFQIRIFLRKEGIFPN